MIKLGSNVTVFLLFFGIALLDALRSRDVPAAFLWLIFGLMFLTADGFRKS